jgi:hypothetical protein
MNARELRIQLEQYLSARSALGIKDRGRKTLLQGFLRYLVKMKYDGSITCRLAVDWATTTPKARATGLAGPSRRLIAARGFLYRIMADELLRLTPGKYNRSDILRPCVSWLMSWSWIAPRWARISVPSSEIGWWRGSQAMLTAGASSSF